MKKFVYLLICVVSAGGARLVTFADAADPVVDPEAWVAPSNFPDFRERLKGEKWNKPFAEALKPFGNLNDLTKSLFPETGTQVIIVEPDKPAAALGIVVGDIVSAIDGQPILRDFKSHRLDQRQQMTLIGKDGKAREITVEAGKIGFHGLDRVWLECIYLRHGTRSDKWDSFVVVGATNCIQHPDLAETAWHHAFAAGYMPDFISDYCAAQIAWRQGRNNDAVAFCARLQSREGIPATFSIEAFVKAIAIANFKLQQAMAEKMIAEPRSVAVDDATERLQSLLAWHQSLPPADRVRPSPSQIARFAKVNLISEIKPVPRGDADADEFQEWATKQLTSEKHQLKEEVPTDHYGILLESPTVDVSNAELIVRVKAKAHDTKQNKFGRQISFALINVDTVNAKNGYKHHRTSDGMLSVTIESTGACLIRQGSERPVILTRAEVADETGQNRQFTLRLLHARGREEVWINQRRLLYVPSVERPSRIGFSLGVQGVDYDAHMEFDKLDPKLAEEK